MTPSVRFLRRFPLLLLAAVALSLTDSPSIPGKELDAGPKTARIREQYGKLPLLFELNKGQTDARVRYLSRSGGVALFLTADEAIMKFRTGAQDSAALAMRLFGAAPSPRITGVEPTRTRTNYFLGKGPANWKTDVETFARIKYESVYPGVDLVWHGDQRQIEHDFLLAPGADPRLIRFEISGAKGVKLNADGSLSFSLDGGAAQFKKPVAWQQIQGKRTTVDCGFRVDRRGRISYRLGSYDKRTPLVIDPILVYSTYLGGSNSEKGFGIAIDKDRNVYVVGSTLSADFPYSTPGPPAGNGTDVFVVKLNPSGTAIVYATWLGGSLEDLPSGIAVDEAGNAYLTGSTSSPNFPTTAGSLQPTPSNGAEAFVSKLDPSGAGLAYSTYLGGSGSDQAHGITVDKTGNAYIVGATDSSELLSAKNITGIQNTRRSTSFFKSTDRAGNWAGSASGLQARQVHAIAIDPKNPTTIYTVTDNGVFKSIDGGGAWAKISDFLFSGTAPASIAIDPVNPTTLYVSEGTRLYKSIDGGQTWAIKTTDLGAGGNLTIHTIAINPATPTTLYIGASKGIFKSLDGGETWATANNGLLPYAGARLPIVEKLVISPANPSTLYAGVTTAESIGVFKTMDGGANWTRLKNGIESYSIQSLAIDPSAPETVYAASREKGVFKTTDGGATWKENNMGLFLAGTSVIPQLLAIEIDPTTPSTVYVLSQTSGVFKTTDRAATWAPANTGFSSASLSTLAIDPANPANLYAGANAGSDGFAAKLNSTGSALSWMTFLGGSGTDEAKAVAIDPDGNAYIAGYTASIDFPVGSPPISLTGNEAFVVKINPSGTAFVYMMRFGGGDNDEARGIAVTSTGQAAVVGGTISTNFPTILPLQTTRNGVSDAFLSMVNSAGTALDSSTYLGDRGTDTANAVALDSVGDLYITGTKIIPFSEAPPHVNDLADVFITKITPRGPALQYNGIYGSSGAVEGTAIAVDPAGNVYLTGTTYSSTMQLINPYQSRLNGPSDIFIAQISGAETVIAASAANYRTTAIAPDSIVSLFGVGLSPGTESALSTPLPVTLQGVSVRLGAPLSLFFVSPNQINLHIPPNLTSGISVGLVLSRTSGPGLPPLSGVFRIENVAPGLFSLDSTGQGVASAVVLRVKADGSQVFEPTVQFDAAQNKFVPIPIDLGPESEQVFAVLYGTGFRRRSGLDRTLVNIGGANAMVSYAGEQGFFPGLDQVNALLPRTLIGRGEVDVVMTVDGAVANTVKLVIK